MKKNSYLTQVKVAKIGALQAIGVALITALAGVFAGYLVRSPSEATSQPVQYWITISAIAPTTISELFPQIKTFKEKGVVSNPKITKVRVIATVNGIGYSYPTRALWAEIGPDMSTESFLLPKPLFHGRRGYSIKLSLLGKDENGEMVQGGSQEDQHIDVSEIPASREYKVFFLYRDLSRGSRTAAIIKYEIRDTPN